MADNLPLLPRNARYSLGIKKSFYLFILKIRLLGSSTTEGGEILGNGKLMRFGNRVTE